MQTNQTVKGANTQVKTLQLLSILFCIDFLWPRYNTINEYYTNQLNARNSKQVQCCTNPPHSFESDKSWRETISHVP